MDDDRPDDYWDALTGPEFDADEYDEYIESLLGDDISDGATIGNIDEWGPGEVPAWRERLGFDVVTTVSEAENSREQYERIIAENEADDDPDGNYRLWP